MKLTLSRDPRITPVKIPPVKSPPMKSPTSPQEKKKTVSPSVAVINLVGGANKPPAAATVSPKPPKKLTQTHLFPKAKAVVVPKLKSDVEGGISPTSQPVRPSSTTHPVLPSTSQPIRPSSTSHPVLPSTSQPVLPSSTATQILPLAHKHSDSTSKQLPPLQKTKSFPPPLIKLPAQSQPNIVPSKSNASATIPASKKISPTKILVNPILPAGKVSPTKVLVTSTQPAGKANSTKTFATPSPPVINLGSTLPLSKATLSLPATESNGPRSSPPLPKIPKTSPPHEDPLLPPKAKKPKTSFTRIPISRVRTIMRTNVNRNPQNPVGQESILVIAKATVSFTG